MMPSELDMALMALGEYGFKVLAVVAISFASLSAWDLLGVWAGRK